MRTVSDASGISLPPSPEICRAHLLSSLRSGRLVRKSTRYLVSHCSRTRMIHEYIPEEEGQGDCEIVLDFHVMRGVRQEEEELLEV